MTDDDKGGPPALSKDPEKAPISLPTRVVHGAYVYIRHGFLPCRGCPDKCEEYDEDGTCAALDRLLEERIRSIMDLPSIHPETDTVSCPVAVVPTSAKSTTRMALAPHSTAFSRSGSGRSWTCPAFTQRQTRSWSSPLRVN